jgi:ribose transport system substrate-binding protein
MKKKIIAGLLILILAGTFSLAAAGAGEEADDGTKTIAFVQGLSTDEFYISMKRGVQEMCDELGYKLIVDGPTKWDYTMQTPIVETMIARKPDLMIIAPVHSDSMIAPLQKVVNAGIPVITVDTNINEELYLCNITSNNLQGGQAAADYLAEMLGETGKVAIMNTNVGVTTTEARAKGFKDELAAKYPNMQIVSDEYCEDEAEKAASIIQAVHLKHPDLAGVFGVNLYASVGVANGLDSKGVNIPIFSYDASPAVIEALAEGIIDATVVQKPMEIGATAVKMASYYFNGEKEKITNVMVENVVATKANMNDPEVSKWFYVSD